MSNFWGAVHFLSESGFGDLKNGGKTNWNPLK